jgi:hypothetical protein
MDPQVQAAFISASGSVIAAVIAALVAGLLGKRFLNQQKLQQDLSRAVQDIDFLLQVEARHCELNVAEGRPSNLRTVRKHVKNINGRSWSGRFTPGRARFQARQLKNADDRLKLGAPHQTVQPMVLGR